MAKAFTQKDQAKQTQEVVQLLHQIMDPCRGSISSLTFKPLIKLCDNKGYCTKLFQRDLVIENLKKGVFDGYLNIESEKSGYTALEAAIVGNESGDIDQSIIDILQAQGAKLGQITPRKLYDHIKKSPALFHALFDQATPETLTEFCAYKPSKNSPNSLELALKTIAINIGDHDVSEQTKIVTKIRAEGAKTQPTADDLNSACRTANAENSLVFKYFLEDISPEMTINLQWWTYSLKTQISLASSGKLMLGRRATAEDAKRVAELISGDGEIKVTFADSAPSEVKNIITCAHVIKKAVCQGFLEVADNFESGLLNRILGYDVLGEHLVVVGAAAPSADSAEADLD